MTKLQRERLAVVKSRLGPKRCAFLTNHYSSALARAVEEDILASTVRLDAYKSGLSRDFLDIRDIIYGKSRPAYDWNLSLMYLWISCELGYKCRVIPSDNSKFHGSVVVNLVEGGNVVCRS